MVIEYNFSYILLSSNVLFICEEAFFNIDRKYQRIYPVLRCVVKVVKAPGTERRLTCSTGREKCVWASISISAARTVSLSTVGRCRRLWTTPRNRGRSLRIVSVIRVTTCRHISASCSTVQKTLPQEITLTNGQYQLNDTIFYLTKSGHSFTAVFTIHILPATMVAVVAAWVSV